MGALAVPLLRGQGDTEEAAPEDGQSAASTGHAADGSSPSQPAVVDGPAAEAPTDCEGGAVVQPTGDQLQSPEKADFLTEARSRVDDLKSKDGGSAVAVQGDFEKAVEKAPAPTVHESMVGLEGSIETASDVAASRKQDVLGRSQSLSKKAEAVLEDGHIQEGASVGEEGGAPGETDVAQLLPDSGEENLADEVIASDGKKDGGDTGDVSGDSSPSVEDGGQETTNVESFTAAGGDGKDGDSDQKGSKLPSEDQAEQVGHNDEAAISGPAQSPAGEDVSVSAGRTTTTDTRVADDPEAKSDLHFSEPKSEDDEENKDAKDTAAAKAGEASAAPVTATTASDVVAASDADAVQSGTGGAEDHSEMAGIDSAQGNAADSENESASPPILEETAAHGSLPADADETTDATEAAAGAVQATETAEAAEATKAVDMSETADVAQATRAVKPADATEAVGSEEIADASGAAEKTGAAEATKPADATEAAEIGRAS